MKNKETTIMRDIMQHAIVRLRLEGNVEALYNIAFRLSTGEDIFTLDLNSNKDIIDTLDAILKEKGFSPLDANSTKFSNISLITIRLKAVVKSRCSDNK